MTNRIPSSSRDRDLSRRRLLQSAALGAGAVALGGIASPFGAVSPARASAQARIGFTPYTYASTLSVQIAEAFKAAAEQLGAVGEAFDGQADSSAQLNGINQLIAKDFNGVALEAVDGGSKIGRAHV